MADNSQVKGTPAEIPHSSAPEGATSETTDVAQELRDHSASTDTHSAANDKPAAAAVTNNDVTANSAESGYSMTSNLSAMGPSPSGDMSPSSTASAQTSSSALPHSASLYAGDLHPDVTEANLYEIFQALGPVQSIRVCRDVVTRRSLGYAYINFHNVTDAERALETMNYYSSALTKNKPLRMMWMIRDPSQRRTGAGNIFVKSLEKSIDNKSLYDTFSQFGTILSCKVATDDNGFSLGHGFVHFETPEAAQAAIDQVNGKLLEGRKVYVGKFLNKREREAAGHISKIFTNVYVKNLDESICNEEKLRDIFSEFGEITSIYIALNDDGKPRGFAFINYASPEMAQRSVDEMNNKDVAGKTLTVCPAQKKAVREAELRNRYETMRMERLQKYQGVNLYIKNLSDDIDDERLRNEFSPYGTITSNKVMRDDKGNSRGFGFVCFTQPEEATRAVTELNGRMIGQKPIYVALAQRKDVRRATLEAQRAMNMRMPPGAMPPAAAAMYGQPSPYMYGQPMPNMNQMGPMGAARGTPYMNQYVAAMGRGGPAAGRGGPSISPQYMAPMGRGQPGMPGAPGAAGPPGMPGVGMSGYNVGQPRQPRQNRQRGGGMQAGGPGMVPNRGNGAGRGRAGPNQGVPPGGVPSVGMVPGQHYKYPSGGRNGPMGVGANGQTPVGVGSQPNGQAGSPDGVSRAPGAPSGGPAEPLTLEMLTNATPHQQKQMLGERLYPLIVAMQPKLGGKITGMLLDMENPEILHLLESPDALAERVEEAVTVLREHAASGEGGQSNSQAQVV